jgi:membrane-bound lytic murein transglycosylase B
LYALYEFVSANQRLPGVHEQHQGVAIGQWAERCRQQQQQEGLEPDLASALQTIPGWSWEPHITALSDSFQENLQQLAAYAQQYGPPPLRSSKKPLKATSRKQKTVPSEAEREAAVEISKQVGCLSVHGMWGGVGGCTLHNGALRRAAAAVPAPF